MLGAKGLGPSVTSSKMAEHSPMSFGFEKCPKYAAEVKILPKMEMRSTKGD